MTSLKLLNFNLNFTDYNTILELLEKDILLKHQFHQIISINPENVMTMTRDHRFAKLVISSQTLIVDGVGIVLAAKLLGTTIPPRLPGVELMDKLITYAATHRLTCLLIGGDANLAEFTANCYSKLYPNLKITGLQGIKNIKQSQAEEILVLKQIVRTTKPCLVFVAFGSPAQESWIHDNRALFAGCLVVGVGGGFAMLSRKITRAPVWLRRLGLEWLFRLVQQPWRLRRQGQLVSFAALVLRQKFQKQ